MTQSNAIASTVKATVFVAVKALRNAFSLLAKVAGPAVMDSPRARTFLRTDETETWIGATSGPVTLLARVNSQSSIDTPAGCHLHDYPFGRLKRIASLVTCDRLALELSDDNRILGVDASGQKGGLSARFQLATGVNVPANAPTVQIPPIPTMERFDYGMAWGIDSAEMIRAIDHAIPSIGKSSRYSTDGIFIECQDNAIALIATDGAKLSRTRLDASTEGYRPAKSMMIPSEALKAVKAFLGDSEGTIRFAFEEQPARHCGIDTRAHYLRFRTGDLDLRIRLDEHASLPKFTEEQVFPATRVASLTFHDVPSLIKAVKAASHDGNVELAYDADCSRVTISAGDGTETEVFPGRGNHEGQSFVRSFDAKALLKYLRSQGKADSLTFGITAHEERKVKSDGKTWDRFGPVSIRSEAGSEFAMQPLDVEATGSDPLAIVEETPSVVIGSVEATPSVEMTVEAETAVLEPIKPLTPAVKPKADPIAHAVPHVVFRTERARVKGMSSADDLVRDAEGSAQLMASLKSIIKAYPATELPKRASFADRVERFILRCVNGSPVSFPEPTPAVEEAPYVELPPSDVFQVNYDLTLASYGIPALCGGSPEADAIIDEFATVLEIPLTVEEDSTPSVEITGGSATPSVDITGGEPMRHFIISEPKPGDDRPRNAFGVLVGFGEAKRAYYARLEAATPSVETMDRDRVDVELADVAEAAFRFRKAHPFGSFACDVMPEAVDRAARNLAVAVADRLPKHFAEPHPHPWYSVHNLAKMVQEQVKGTSYYLALVAVGDHFPTLFAPDDLAPSVDITPPSVDITSSPQEPPAVPQGPSPIATEDRGYPVLPGHQKGYRALLVDAFEAELAGLWIPMIVRTASDPILCPDGDDRRVWRTARECWERMSYHDHELFVEWATTIGYRPGGDPIGDDVEDTWLSFVQDCLLGYPLPTHGPEPEGDDDGDDEGGVDSSPDHRDGQGQGGRAGALESVGNRDASTMAIHAESPSGRRDDHHHPRYLISYFNGGFAIYPNPLNTEPTDEDDSRAGNLGTGGFPGLHGVDHPRPEASDSHATHPALVGHAGHAGDLLPPAGSEAGPIEALDTLTILVHGLGQPAHTAHTGADHGSDEGHLSQDLRQGQGPVPDPRPGDFPALAGMAGRGDGRRATTYPLHAAEVRREVLDATPHRGPDQTLPAAPGQGPRLPSSGVLTIGGRPYSLTSGPGWLDLEKSSGESYRVTLEGSEGPSCECRDFRYRRAGLDSLGCKHLRFLRAEGLLPRTVPSYDLMEF